MQTDLFEYCESGAKFSPCRKYRFVLYRIWDKTKPFIMFIGLNPSKANEDKNDATIRRVMSMAKSWDYGGIYMLNCFPFISTNPDDLNDCSMLEENDLWLRTISYKCKDIVFAWGSFDIVKDKKRDYVLSEMFPNAKALIINRDGSPRHPLYVQNKVCLIPYTNKYNEAIILNPQQ